MNCKRVKAFRNCIDIDRLEYKINEFIKCREIVSVSIAYDDHGYVNAMVIYIEN